ncbi:ABC transporter substrate-binding protein [Fundidesulfovibrio agrisoli]|uniref:ABC transporter substrate-binding protein n=1 Tax=Fundidesulfovibrio agrisoli TaxID=2922717 RepID=UPI001FAD46E3|nr:ABC transporter substrate-binding protein [Fundidesulfovibrio agrisoli]
MDLPGSGPPGSGTSPRGPAALVLPAMVLAAALWLALLAPSAAHGRTLKLALDSIPYTLDYMSALSGNLTTYAHWVFDPLARRDREMKLEPRLAERWLMQDQLTLRVYLRTSVTFHSGNRLTARDVVWTVRRARNSPAWKALFSNLERVEAVGEHTVDFHFSRPEPLAVNLLCFIFPMDSKFYQGADAQGRPRDAIYQGSPVFAHTTACGTGPFLVAGFDPERRLTLERFPDYWDDRSQGNADKAVVTAMPDAVARCAALISGAQDCVSPVAPQETERLRKTPEVRLAYMASSRVITIGFNPAASPEFKDRRVRQAFIAAINSAGIVDKVMNKLTVPANQLSARGMPGFNPDLSPRYNPEKAKELLREAGLEGGMRVSMIAPANRYTNDVSVAEAVVGMLARIGVTVDLEVIPLAQYWAAFQERRAGLQMVGWQPDTEDSANSFQFLLMCRKPEGDVGSANSGYCNPDLDEMVAAAASECDPLERGRILRGAERLAYDDAACITLHYEPLTWAFRSHVRLERAMTPQNSLLLGEVKMD